MCVPICLHMFGAPFVSDLCERRCSLRSHMFVPPLFAHVCVALTMCVCVLSSQSLTCQKGSYHWVPDYCTVLVTFKSPFSPSVPAPVVFATIRTRAATSYPVMSVTVLNTTMHGFTALVYTQVSPPPRSPPTVERTHGAAICSQICLAHRFPLC